MDYKKDLADKLPQLKKIEGFPIGKDEDILALSQPPYYTACPNPYIEDFIKEHGKPYDEKTDTYYREPFIGDVSEGRNDPIYLSHTYVTKVPYKAIQKYIEHYTLPNDIVLDGFCGSGMTGVASIALGRTPILSDLSTIATYIAVSFNATKNVIDLYEKFTSIYKRFKNEYEWMYTTNHIDGRKGIVTYTVWSDLFLCPHCSQEFNFWKEGLDFIENQIKDKIQCKSCHAEFEKNDCAKSYETYVDPLLGKEVKIAKQEPVLIKYSVGKKSYEKEPDSFDKEILSKINQIEISEWVPTDLIPDGHNTSQPIRSHGFENVHHFFTKRTLVILAALNKELNNDEKVLLTSMLNRASRTVKTLLSNYFSARKGKTIGGWAGTPLTGTLYIPSISTEISILESIKNRTSSLLAMENEKNKIFKKNNFFISTNSVTSIPIPDNSIDYIFTDPPFGDNKMYSELNFISEAWLKVKTNNLQEAIVNKVQNKTEDDYKLLMRKAFEEYFRVLKPKRWITVEFNNSKSSVWNLIQESITKSGFVIAQVSILDKKQGSFKQVTSANSVKSDLVISAFKPSNQFTTSFIEKTGKDYEMHFTLELLTNLPSKPVVERTDKMLYSKMLAYYIQRGYEIRYDAKSFYSMLNQNFVQEDGFWFTANQINSYLEYKKKMKLEGMDDVKAGGMYLFVSDEKSAIVWLFNFLSEPKSFSEISVAFNQLANIQGDAVPELRDLLEQNFVAEDGKYRRPKSEPEHNQITEKRERALMREFESLLIQAKTEKKKIKDVRKEALVFGFEVCYKDKRFKDIMTLAQRLDKSILENSGELNDFVEAAQIQLEGIS